MDPVALAAVVGLVFAGKHLSSQPKEIDEPVTRKPITRRDVDLMNFPAEHSADYFDLRPTNPALGRRIGDWRLQKKDVVPSLQDQTRVNTRMPYGQPVYDLYNRQFVTNKQNNLAPLEQPMRVGPGLGVGPDVPSAGGFQDYFRALPVNVNEERLTTLKGVPGTPAYFVKNGGAAYIGDITQEASASKTAYRAPAAYGGGGAQGALTGFEGRPSFPKTKRMTSRAETGLRTDTLSEGPPQYNVYQPYAEAKDAYTDISLTRSSGNRANPDRAGNGGRMNVRNDPVNQVGSATMTRVESVPIPPGPMGPTGNNTGTYKAPLFDDPLNEKKAQLNPRGQSQFLDIAIQQLENNPLAYSLADPPKK